MIVRNGGGGGGGDNEEFRRKDVAGPASCMRGLVSLLELTPVPLRWLQL